MIELLVVRRKPTLQTLLGFAPTATLVKEGEDVGFVQGGRTKYSGTFALAEGEYLRVGNSRMLTRVQGFLHGSATPCFSMGIDDLLSGQTIHESEIRCSLRSNLRFDFDGARESLFDTKNGLLAQFEPAWRDSDAKAKIVARLHLHPSLSNEECALYISVLRLLLTEHPRW